MSLNLIYNIVGESVNSTMMAATIDVVKQEYFNNVTYPSIKKGDLEDSDN
jgi:cAMP phosphodiesterase